MTQPLALAALWRDTQAVVQRNFGLFLSITAAFVLLPEVLLALYGPVPPTSMAAVTPRQVALLVVLPSIIAAVAQLAIVRLIVDDAARKDTATGTVGAALRAALLALPVLVLAMLIVALPLSVGLLLGVLPGLYLMGRLALVLPVIIIEHRSPMAAVERSWALTLGNGWRAAVFIVALSVLVLLGQGVAAGLGAAFGSVLTLGLGKGIGALAAATVSGAAAAAFTVANAGASATLYLHLRQG